MTGRQRLVVVPSDPLEAYIKKGRGDLLEDYYNPCKFFDEVFLLSPLEQGNYDSFGMHVIGVSRRDFKRRLAQLNPDVVRAYGGYWAADFVCRNRVRNIPIMVSVHDPNPDYVYSAVRYANLVACTSTAVKHTVLKRGVREDRIHLLPNRIDLNVFYPVPVEQCREHLPPELDGRPFVLTVGRASIEKNRPVVIRALQHLPQEIMAVFIGHGPDLEDEVALARSLNVLDRCCFIDTVPNNQLKYLYSSCLCLCNLSRWEGFGLIFVEAASCGAVVITSARPPMADMFSHMNDGILIEDIDSERQLADEVLGIYENSSLRQRLKEAVIAIAQRYSKESIDAMEVDLYKKVMASPDPSAVEEFRRLVWRARTSKIGDILTHPVAHGRDWIRANILKTG